MNSLIDHPGLWRAASLILIAAVAAGPAFISTPIKSRNQIFLRISFLLACIFALICWRTPTLLLNTELNVDESQTIAQAICFRYDPIPWRSADPGTNGPLNTYVYMWTYLIGNTPTHLTLRWTTLFFACLTLLSLRKIANHILPFNLSFFATIPCLLFYLMAADPDFVHASTEYLPVCLMAAALALGLPLCLGEISPWRCAVVGFLLGTIPFAKLQAVPAAGLLGLFFAANIFFSSRRRNALYLSVLLVSATACTIFFFLLAATGGVLNEMWFRYLAQNWLYSAGDTSPTSSLETFRILLRCSKQFTIYLAWLAGVLLAVLPLALRQCRQSWKATLFVLAFLLWAVACLYSVVRSGCIFPHYLTLLTFPISVCAIFAFSLFQRLGQTIAIRTCLCLGCISPMLHWWATGDSYQIYISSLKSKLELRDGLSQFISDKLAPGERLGIWGWTPRYYAETKTRSATRDLVTHFLIIQNAYTAHYRNVYLEDLKDSKPKLFLDTATDITSHPDYPPVAQRRHTCFAPLRDFIAENYDKVGEFVPANYQEPFLIYQLKESTR